ncbi:macrolide resistance MFS transporter Mrx(A) [soil metagenome]
MLAADAVSITGNMLTLIAVPWFVLQTTGSAAKTGLTVFFTTLPVILSASLGGTIVERLGYRRASIVSDLASGLSVVLIPVMYYTVGLAFWQLLVLVFAGALLDAPGQTARSSLLPDLAATAGMRIERASSAYDGVSRGARMVGGLAGVLIATIGPAQVLFVDAGTFLASAFIVRLLVSDAHGRPSEGHQPYLRALRDGLSFIWRDRLLRAIVLMVMVTNMLDTAMFSVMLPVYATRVLGSPIQLGIIISAFGVGALTGTIVFGAIGHRMPRRITYGLAFLLVGSPRFFVLAAFPSLGVIVVVMVVAGIACGAINPILSTVEYERVPLKMRARVFGTVTAGVWAAMPIGALLAGSLTEVVGIRAALVAAGVAYLAATLSPILFPSWREMDAGPRTASRTEAPEAA